jgi:hypothetical protein
VPRSAVKVMGISLAIRCRKGTGRALPPTLVAEPSRPWRGQPLIDGVHEREVPVP